MKIQVLVATMNQNDHSLLQKMNIQSDAIVGNQCDLNSVENFNWNGHQITYLNFKEKGVGLNRNNALIRANADVCLFADDDMEYVDNYVELIQTAFKNHPEADVILFNLNDPTNSRYMIKQVEKVHYLNYLRYGAVRVAVKLDRIKENAIYFNQLFGGGCEYCHGEDNLFLTACLKNKLKLVAVPMMIATLKEERASTWNTGYDDKYLRDQGVLYKAISRRWWKLLCLQDVVRRHKSYQCSRLHAYKKMIQGGTERKF